MVSAAAAILCIAASVAAQSVIDPSTVSSVTKPTLPGYISGVVSSSVTPSLPGVISGVITTSSAISTPTGTAGCLAQYNSCTNSSTDSAYCRLQYDNCVSSTTVAPTSTSSVVSEVLCTTPTFASGVPYSVPTGCVHVNCTAAYDDCVADPNISHTDCESGYQSCIGNTTVSTSTTSSISIISTPPPTSMGTNCTAQFDECTGVPGANGATCEVQYQKCIGNPAYTSSLSYTTTVVTAYTTVCPTPTMVTIGPQTWNVTSSTTITVTNCPCTITTPVSTATPWISGWSSSPVSPPWTSVWSSPVSTYWTTPSSGSSSPVSTSWTTVSSGSPAPTSSSPASYTGAAVKNAGAGGLMLGALALLAL